MSAKPIHSAVLLALLATGCSELPQQKPFPEFAKMPDEGAGSPQPAGPASTEVADASTSASLLARKVQTTRSTLDLAVDTARQRLTKLKQQIVDARQTLDEQGGRRANPEQYAALREAQDQIELALTRTRGSTSRRVPRGVPEQAETVRDLGGLIASVSGVVDTISGGSTAPPAALSAEAAIAQATPSAPAVGPGGPPQPGQPGIVTASAVPPGAAPGTGSLYETLLARAKPSRPLGIEPAAAPPGPSPAAAASAPQPGQPQTTVAPAPPQPAAPATAPTTAAQTDPVYELLRARAKPSRPLEGEPPPAASIGPAPAQAAGGPQPGQPATTASPAAPQPGRLEITAAPAAPQTTTAQSDYELLLTRAKPSRPLPTPSSPPAEGTSTTP
ncbi:hypothetical protein KXR53_09280 [Inquilinus limosus]|uniref:hypothetical protein n=1 Tax=Inquilinus limosus TaxID=171674 RepID=UPI003F15EDCC